MSVAGDMITAITTDIEAAIAGVTVVATTVVVDDLPEEDFPFAALYQTDYSGDVLEWGQEKRTYTIRGLLAEFKGTRETMALKLEAVLAQIIADPTLDGSVEHATFGSSLVHSHSDEERIFGTFFVEGEVTV